MEPAFSIAYLTSGAGGMYCGSCLRDNALARALLRAGCQIELLPTYTPIRTDEEDVSSPHVFFGGINVYLQQQFRLARWLPRWTDRWLDRPGLLNWVTRGRIRTSARDLGELTVSMLAGETGNQRKEVERLVDYLADTSRPQLVNFSSLLIAGCAPALRRRLAAPLLVTLQGDDLFLNGLPPRYRDQALTHITRIAQHVDGFLTFSRYYADFMADWLQLPREKFHLVPLGIDADDFPTDTAVARRPTGATIGYLARHCPEKGLHLVVDAFLQLRQRPELAHVKLRTAGWLGADDEAFFQEQARKVQQAGAAADFHYAGAVDRAGKVDFLANIDVMSVPTTYREPKGLSVLESLAAGVPVVQPDHGAFPELLASTGGGELFPAGDVPALTDRLATLLTDSARRSTLATTGQQQVRQSHTATAMAQATLEVYQSFVGRS